MSPTERQRDVLRFIRSYNASHGYSPCMREIAANLGLRSQSGVYRMLVGLEERGLIRRLANRARAIELIDKIPVSRAPDGAPLYFVRVE